MHGGPQFIENSGFLNRIPKSVEKVSRAIVVAAYRHKEGRYFDGRQE